MAAEDIFTDLRGGPDIEGEAAVDILSGEGRRGGGRGGQLGGRRRGGARFCILTAQACLD